MCGGGSCWRGVGGLAVCGGGHDYRGCLPKGIQEKKFEILVPYRLEPVLRLYFLMFSIAD